jgi:hypothetical protein
MFKKIGNNIASRISPTRTHWSGLKTDLADRLRHFRFERDTRFQKALEENFTLLLRAWGIESEAEIPGVIADLRLRCPILLVPVLGASVCALCLPDLYGWLTLYCIAPPCLFGLLVTRWRISILQNRAFQPLFRWLFARFTTKNQRSA